MKGDEELCTYEGVVSEAFREKYLTPKKKEGTTKSRGIKTVNKPRKERPSYRVPVGYQNWKAGYGYRIMQYNDAIDYKK